MENEYIGGITAIAVTPTSSVESIDLSIHIFSRDIG